MARNQSGPEEERPVIRHDVEHFDDPAEMRERILEVLAEDTDRTPEEFRAAVEGYPMPDPEDLETIPAEEFYGED